MKTPAPTPGLVAYEANPTATNEETGVVQTLNPHEYPTEACCEFVKHWLENDSRTSPVGPFTITSEDESEHPWKYSVLFREIVTTNRTEIDPGLWYQAIQIGEQDVAPIVAELVTDATGGSF